MSQERNLTLSAIHLHIGLIRSMIPHLEHFEHLRDDEKLRAAVFAAFEEGCCCTVAGGTEDNSMWFHFVNPKRNLSQETSASSSLCRTASSNRAPTDGSIASTNVSADPSSNEETEASASSIARRFLDLVQHKQDQQKIREAKAEAERLAEIQLDPKRNHKMRKCGGYERGRSHDETNGPNKARFFSRFCDCDSCNFYRRRYLDGMRNESIADLTAVAGFENLMGAEYAGFIKCEICGLSHDVFCNEMSDTYASDHLKSKKSSRGYFLNQRVFRKLGTRIDKKIGKRSAKPSRLPYCIPDQEVSDYSDDDLPHRGLFARWLEDEAEEDEDDDHLSESEFQDIDEWVPDRDHCPSESFEDIDEWVPDKKCPLNEKTKVISDENLADAGGLLAFKKRRL